MVEKTDKYDFNQELIEYYKEKVFLMEQCRKNLTQYERARRNSGEDHKQAEAEFDEKLDELVYFAYPKIKKSSNIEIPDSIDNKIDDKVFTVDELSREEKKELLYKIRVLFEALNITSLEREKWEAEGIGAVDKKAGDKQ